MDNDRKNSCSECKQMSKKNQALFKKIMEFKIIFFLRY